jgi:hypothetical protein
MMKATITAGKVYLESGSDILAFPVSDLAAAITALHEAKNGMRLQSSQDVQQRIPVPKRYQHLPRINRDDLMELELRKSGSGKAGLLLLTEGITRGNMKERAAKLLRAQGHVLKGRYDLRFRKVNAPEWEVKEVLYA